MYDGAVDGIRTRTIQLGKLACCRYTTTAGMLPFYDIVASLSLDVST